MNDGTIPQAHQLTPTQVAVILRDDQRKNVALEKILSIVGEHSPAGQIALSAMGKK